jgi:hypothetical protein
MTPATLTSQPQGFSRKPSFCTAAFGVLLPA